MLEKSMQLMPQSCDDGEFGNEVSDYQLLTSPAYYNADDTLETNFTLTAIDPSEGHYDMVC